MAARQLTATLENKFGFTPKQGRHVKYRLEVDGVYVASTQVSHGWGDIGDQMLAKIARQIGATAQQLRLMVSCSIGPEEYLILLVAQPENEISDT